MKSILIIGLGRFGRHMARKFNDMGCEIMIADKSEEAITSLASEISNAQIGDCTKEGVLRAMGVSNFDICVVAIASDFQSSLEITYLLKSCGAKYVISKANRDIHAEFLLRNGADEVVYPEREIAERTVMKHCMDNVLDYIEITHEYSILEVAMRESWVGKSVESLAVRTKYHITILATKDGNEIKYLGAGHIFARDENLMIFGEKEDVLRFAAGR